MERIKANLKTILLVLATVILAAIAIITAWRLYQLRQEAVAPTAPKPAAAAPPQLTQCTQLSFNLTPPIGGPSPSPTPTPSPGPTPTPSPGPTATPTPSPGPTATPKPTATPAPVAAAPGVTATPTAALPVAGVSWPTITVAISGIVLLALGLFLAF